MKYRVPCRVGYVVTESESSGTFEGRLRVVLVHLPDGQPMCLAGSAALIWLVAMEGSRQVAQDVALDVDQPLEVVRTDVEDFLADLVERGLLEPVADRPGCGEAGR